MHVMHKIEQTTTGAISVIRENSVKCGNSWCLSERGYQVAQRKPTVEHATFVKAAIRYVGHLLTSR